MFRAFLSLALLISLSALALAWPPPEGKGPPPGKGPPAGKGPGGDPQFVVDRDTFHYLLDNRAKIRRTIKKLADGVETLTESDDREVTAKIQEHVKAMHERVKEGRGIHLRDPLFAALFRNYKTIKMELTKTEKGMKVVERSDDPLVAVMIQAHAEAVSQFIAKGYEEVHKNHPVPEAPKKDGEKK